MVSAVAYSLMVQNAIQSMSLESTTNLNKLTNLLFNAMHSDELYRVYIAGNGGSSCIAQHFAADLSKLANIATKDRVLEVVNLTDNVALLTAFANDINWSEALCRVMESKFADGEKPILITISSSGESKNILHLLDYAHIIGVNHTYAFVGFDGGEILTDYSDKVNMIHVPTTSYEVAEDAHMMLLHCIVKNFRESLIHDGRRYYPLSK